MVLSFLLVAAPAFAEHDNGQGNDGNEHGNNQHNQNHNSNRNRNRNQNTNINVNQQRQSQKQSQTQKQIQGQANQQNVTVGGDKSAAIPPSAYAPALTSGNDTCMGSTSVGLSGGAAIGGGGLAFGKTWTDYNCVRFKLHDRYLLLFRVTENVEYLRAAEAILLSVAEASPEQNMGFSVVKVTREKTVDAIPASSQSGGTIPNPMDDPLYR